LTRDGRGEVHPALPIWLRLRRAGQAVTSFESVDGVAWKQVAMHAVPFEGAALIGMAIVGDKQGVVELREVSVTKR
jgi:regulation of enolase protein 1 (concanavalin A-like superfamily)